MPQSVIQRHRRWHQYECDAHVKTLHSLETVSAERRDSAEYRRALSILGHVLTARRIWLARLGVTPPVAGSLFPEIRDASALADEQRSVAALWENYLAQLNDSDLDRVIEYQSLDAGRFRNRVEDVLTQLFGHSWYHRGQIAMLVRAAGGEPAITDFIYWCREAIT